MSTLNQLCPEPHVSKDSPSMSLEGGLVQHIKLLHEEPPKPLPLNYYQRKVIRCIVVALTASMYFLYHLHVSVSTVSYDQERMVTVIKPHTRCDIPKSSPCYRSDCRMKQDALYGGSEYYVI